MFKLLDLTNEQHDEFVKSHKYGDICQLSNWANVKAPFWYSKRVAVGNENDKIFGVGQLLFRKIPRTSMTICYVSRGFVCDYEDMEVVKSLLNETIKVAREEKAVVIKIDPIVEREIKPNLHKELEKLGFKHRGFTIGFSDYNPRFSMVTDISKDEDSVFKSFNSRAKTNIKKATKYGLSFETVGLDEVDKFIELMEITGKRDGFLTRSGEYLSNLIYEMQKTDDAFLVLIKMYPQTTIKILREEYNSILKELEKSNKKLDKLEEEDKIKNTKLQISEIKNRKEKISSLIGEIEPLTEKNDEVVLSGSILTFCGEKAYYLYGASSNDFRELLSNYFMQWEMIKFSKSRGCTSYDFGGISGIMNEGDKEYGLFDFKRRFNSEINEKIGEFDFVLKPIVFFTIDKMLLWVRKFKNNILSKIRNNH